MQITPTLVPRAYEYDLLSAIWSPRVSRATWRVMGLVATIIETCLRTLLHLMVTLQAQGLVFVRGLFGRACKGKLA